MNLIDNAYPWLEDVLWTKDLLVQAQGQYFLRADIDYCDKQTISWDVKTSGDIGNFETPNKKRSFPLQISSVNVTKSAVSCGFGHIYWRNP